MIKTFQIKRAACIDGPHRWSINVFRDESDLPDTAHWVLFSRGSFATIFGTIHSDDREHLIEQAFMTAVQWKLNNVDYYATACYGLHCVLSRAWVTDDGVLSNPDWAFFVWAVGALKRGHFLRDLQRLWREHECEIVGVADYKQANEAMRRYMEGSPVYSIGLDVSYVKEKPRIWVPSASEAPK